MEWPSKNIPRGGVFNSAKVNYTPETKQFIKTLIDESKMTMTQRNKRNYTLRNGEPISSCNPPRGRHRNQLFEVTIRPGSSKRRSLETIQQSGAYERDRFRSNQPIVDREKAKEALINKMAYGDLKPDNKEKLQREKKNKEPPKEINRYDELKEKIKEREDWLAEMEELGEGHKYRGLIRLQVLDLLKEMEALKVQP